MGLIEGMAHSWADMFTPRKVFGEPIERDGVVVIPVAMVAGGGGGGGGKDPENDGAEGEGGGFGGVARPAGVYVVTADGVEWQPAVDVTLLGVSGILLAALIALIAGRALKKRR